MAATKSKKPRKPTKTRIHKAVAAAKRTGNLPNRGRKSQAKAFLRKIVA